MASYMQNAAAQCTPAQPGQSQLPATLAEAKSSGDNIVRATPDSQDDVIIGETKVGTADGDADLPIQLGQWLQSFQGTEVAVAANGQCAILAILATSMNHQGREMKNSTDVVEEATELKWYVYTLMMANLRKDVELHLVDPISECNKLYPDQVKYGSVQGATAALYAHYDAARRRSAGTQVPPTFWAGPHELRAMAQYLREPILVFDVNPAGDAHVQRYSYGMHRLKDGADHESGCCNTATDREATEYLLAPARATDIRRATPP
ncbi:hypothetical protein PF003_g3713 [Phytophthora fragariae]|nr:hypothetical protein PF003_g3713 [Phytophthora fragariae]